MSRMTHLSTSQEMVSLPLVGPADEYHAHTIEMLDDAEARQYWLNVFRSHTPGLAERAASTYSDQPDAAERAEQFREAFNAVLDRIETDPFTYGHLNIGVLCGVRQELLTVLEFDDPYLPIKHEENEAALAMLPGLLSELDAMDDAERLRHLVAGVFAGNIFDLGAAETVKLYEDGQTDFHDTREQVWEKAWLVDHLAEAEATLGRKSHRRAVLFVDNAGADVVLGMIPLARHLLNLGTEVVLTANTHPALNDITHDELAELIERIAETDSVIGEALAIERLTLVPSGNGLPVIDLSRVDARLAAAAEDADLLVLEGMGRALETNYRHQFTCDTLKLAMIKEQHVADILGGQLYDVVCRFDPARDG